MSKKARYLLILSGVILFLIAAPLIVLYVRGVGFDFQSRKFYKTGILAIRTEPKDVLVYADGKLALRSSGDLKFLLPRDYSISIKKDGYFEWKKRMTILPGQVTWANPVPNKLFLFLEKPEVQTLAAQIKDFHLSGDTLLYLAENSVVLADARHPESSQSFTLPKNANKIIPSPDGQLFLLTGFSSATDTPSMVLAFEKNNGRFTDLSSLFLKPAELKFSGNGQLFALENGQLSKIDVAAKTKTIIEENVQTFEFRENDLYYIRRIDSRSELLLAGSPGQSQVILSELPAFENGSIYINYERQMLLLLDQTLYQVGAALEKLADSVNDQNFSYSQSTLVFSHSGELSYYNPFSHNVNFITRSNAAISKPQLNLALADSFFVRGNGLEVLELDTRDHQNNYTLYQGANLQKFQLDDSVQTAFVLDDGNLKTIKIR